MRLRPSFLLAGLLGVWASCSGASWAQVPRINKIDPPGWWVQFPNPMLLVHGEALNRAKFCIDGKGVKLARVQASANGHWVFLWLDIQSAPQQTLLIRAVSSDGQARSSYVLAEPSHADELITQRLKEMLGQLEVKLLDHCIVGGNQVMSFAERGLI